MKLCIYNISTNQSNSGIISLKVYFRLNYSIQICTVIVSWSFSINSYNFLLAPSPHVKNSVAEQNKFPSNVNSFHSSATLHSYCVSIKLVSNLRFNKLKQNEIDFIELISHFLLMYIYLLRKQYDFLFKRMNTKHYKT
jgi:hypothetical protein